MTARELPQDRGEARAYASELTVQAQTDAPWVGEAIAAALDEAAARGWDDIRLALMHVRVIHTMAHHSGSVSELIDDLESEAQRLGCTGLEAVAVVDRIRYLRNLNGGAPFQLLARARVLLADESPNARDRISGLINLALEFDSIGLAEMADQALTEAATVAEQLKDNAEPLAVIANNRANRLVRRATTLMMEGDRQSAGELLVRSDRISTEIDPRCIPEAWFARLVALRRIAGAMFTNTDVKPDEFDPIAASLAAVDYERLVLLRLVLPLDLQEEPTTAELNALDDTVLAWFLRVRSLERAGRDGVVLLDALKRLNALLLEQSARHRCELETGIAAMVEAQTLAQERGELVELAMTDPLTGLSNRRAFEECLAGLDGAPATLVLFDLDDFKSINDTYGHQTGDVVLQGVAATLAATGQSFEVQCASRLGGDEFAVVFAGSVAGRAEAFASSVSRQIGAVEWPNDIIPSVTAGIASHRESSALVDQADQQLYRNKSWTARRRLRPDLGVLSAV